MGIKFKVILCAKDWRKVDEVDLDDMYDLKNLLEAVCKHFNNIKFRIYPTFKDKNND